MKQLQSGAAAELGDALEQLSLARQSCVTLVNTIASSIAGQFRTAFDSESFCYVEKWGYFFAHPWNP